jgi:hypothetical protein
MKTLVLLILLNHADGSQTDIARYEMAADQCLSMQAAIWENKGPTFLWQGEPEPVLVVDAACVSL